MICILADSKLELINGFIIISGLIIRYLVVESHFVSQNAASLKYIMALFHVWSPGGPEF